MILILGPDDAQTQQVIAKIEARGHQVVIWDTRAFPIAQSLSFNDAHPPEGQIGLGKVTVNLAEVEAIYWYHYMGTYPIYHAQLPNAMQLYENSEITLKTFLRCMPCRWVNPPQVLDQQKYLLFQLKRLRELGLPVSRTCLTNQPEALETFCPDEPIMIFSPTHHYRTEVLSPEDRAATLAQISPYQPVIAQQWIPGQTIQVLCIGSSHFAFSESSEPIALPDAILEQCRLIMRGLDLVMAGITLRQSDAGGYVYLQVDPVPHFIDLETQSNQPLSNCLAAVLTATPFKGG